MLKEYIKKIKVMPYCRWDHHHSGWAYCVEGILSALHDEEKKVLFFPNNIIKIIDNSIQVDKPWTGVLHFTPTCIKEKINLIKEKKWQKNCLGLYVLSENTYKELNKHIDLKICKLNHAIKFTKNIFEFKKFENNKNKKIFFVGGWLRNFNIFEKINIKYKKIVIKCPGIGFDYKGNLEKIEYLNNIEYEKNLQENLIFLDFIDTTINNIVLECMVRNTPICIKKHPSIIEYLGKDYPFYFENIEEAQDKINNYELIYNSFIYLKNLNKEKIKIKNFIKEIYNSSIYQEIKYKTYN